MEFITALLSIVVIDLVLAGDNAIVIGMAARNLPKQNQKKVIIWGTVGAIVVRSVLTLIVVWLLMVPGLRLIGGLLLVWIAYKLLIEEKNDDNIKAGTSIWAAIRTIIIADTAMGLDNVLAVAGAAQGHFILVILGLLISIPIVVWGSTLILRLMDRYPFIIFIGAGVLAWTSSKMIVEEPFIHGFFADHIVIKYLFEIVVVALVIAAGVLTKKKNNVGQVKQAS